MAALDTDRFHRCALGGQAVGHDGLGPAAALHLTLKKRLRRLAIPAFRGEDLTHLAFVADGPPKIVHLAFDLYEDLVQVPAPPGDGRQPLRRQRLIPAANMGPKRFHQNRTLRSTALRAVADIDASLKQQILDLS